MVCILPAPLIPSYYEDVNTFLRGEADRSFKWQAVVQPPETPPDEEYAHAYRLEITPDIGAVSIDDLFGAGNPRLKVFDMLVPGVDLTAGPDYLIYQVSEADWRELTNPAFHRYFWRVTAITLDSELGCTSDVNVFEMQTEISNSEWAIVETPKPREFAQVVAGTKSTKIAAIHVLGQAPEVIYPTPTSWRLELPLLTTKNTYFVRAEDTAGNFSAYKPVSVKLEVAVPVDWKLWNSLDEMALLVGLERYDGEDNPTFKTRVIDAYRHRAGSDYVGLRNALTRSFGLLDSQRDQALLITRQVQPGADQAPAQVLQISFGATSVSVFGQQLRAVLERQVVDGHTWTASLDRAIEDFEPWVEHPIGHRVPRHRYAVENGEGRIRFLTPDYNGKEVYVSYDYRIDVAYGTKTVSELAEALEEITIDGLQAMNVAVDSEVEDELAAGLEQIPQTPVLNSSSLDAGGVEVVGMPVRWSPVRVFALQDADFQRSYLNENGNLFSTLIDSLAEQLRGIAGITWGFLVADRAPFVDDERLRGQAGIPVTADIPYGVYKSSLTGLSYDHHQYSALGGLDPADGSSLMKVGVLDILLKSGVGSQKDLLVTMKNAGNELFETPETETAVVQTDSSALEEIEDTGPTGSGEFDMSEYGW